MGIVSNLKNTKTSKDQRIKKNFTHKMGTVQLHKKPHTKQSTHRHVQTVHLHIMFQECVMFMTVQIGIHILNLYNLIHITRFLLRWKFFGFLLEDFGIVLIFYLTSRNETNTPSRYRGVWQVETIVPHSIHEFIPMIHSSQNNSCQVFC